MASALLYPKCLEKGTVATSSASLPIDSLDVVASLELDAEDIADAAFEINLVLYGAVRPGEWHALATKDWKGGPGAVAPFVQWSGIVPRVKLTIDLSRPASVGASLTY